jgi:beta-glucosidase-like glycosyl hydrolase
MIAPTITAPHAPPHARRRTRPQVLLKNVGGVLPLSRSRVKTVYLQGTAADSVGRMCGGWTIVSQA